MVGASISEPCAAERKLLLRSRNRNCSSGDGAKRVDTEGKRRSATLDLDILDCPICYEALTTPIFQCDNGHLACSSCCPTKCPLCALPIGHNRCRAMESLPGTALFPCSNAKFGCNKIVTCGEESAHEKKCTFSPCSCPVHDCNYTNSYKDLNEHYISIHLM